MQFYLLLSLVGVWLKGSGVIHLQHSTLLSEPILGYRQQKLVMNRELPGGGTLLRVETGRRHCKKATNKERRALFVLGYMLYGFYSSIKRQPRPKKSYTPSSIINRHLTINAFHHPSDGDLQEFVWNAEESVLATSLIWVPTSQARHWSCYTSLMKSQQGRTPFPRYSDFCSANSNNRRRTYY